MNRTVFMRQMIEEPYRIFFPLGILIALAGVGHWPAYWLGGISSYSTFFHSSLQTQSYLVCFVVGFLLTAMPRFTAAAPPSFGEILRFTGLIAGNAAALFAGQWILAELLFCGVLISLLLFAVKRVTARPAKSSGAQPPLEFVWVPFALIHGLCGAVLLVLVKMKAVSAGFYQTAKLLSEQGFILCIVIGIGGFLAPRLMGTFRTLNLPGERLDSPRLTELKRRILLFHAVCGCVFFSSFWIPQAQASLAYAVRALIITLEYLWTCSGLVPPRTPDLYVRLLWVSLWMVVLGSWAAVFFPQYRTAVLHVIFIGGFSLMIFSVATMVVLSHGGEPDQVKRPLPVLWAAGIAVAGSLILRLCAGIFPSHYFPLLGWAGLLWSGAAAFWFFFALPKMFRVMGKEEMERCHEEAKERVIQLRKTAAPASSSGECCGQKNTCGHS